MDYRFVKWGEDKWKITPVISESDDYVFSQKTASSVLHNIEKMLNNPGKKPAEILSTITGVITKNDASNKVIGKEVEELIKKYLW